MILVSSALGIIGRELLFLLAEQGHSVRAMVPSAGGARHLTEWLGEQLTDAKNIELVEFVFSTFEGRESVERAMDGVTSAILILPSIMEEGVDALTIQRDFFESAEAAGVKRMVNLSGSAAAQEVDTTVGRMLAAGEVILEQTSMEYTHLRFPFFMLMQNVRVYAEMIRTTNQLLLPLGGRAVAMIDARDIASVAAVTLTKPGHEGQTYMLTGPQALDGAGVARALTETRGKDTEYIPVLPAVTRQLLESMSVPEFLIDDALALYADGVSESASLVTGNVEAITGKAPRTIQDYLQFEAWAWEEEEGQLNGWNE